MAFMVLYQCLLTASVLHVTSSQATHDVSSCEHTNEPLNHLMTTVSQLTTAVTRLQKEVVELKTGARNKDMRGTIY